MSEPLAAVVFRLSACETLLRIAGEKTLWNRLVLAFDGSFLILLVSCTHYAYRSDKEEPRTYLNYVCSVVFVVCAVPCTIGLSGYLLYNIAKLGTAEMQDRIGAAYQSFEIKRVGRPAVVYIFLSYARRIALCLIVIFARSNLVT